MIGTSTTPQAQEKNAAAHQVKRGEDVSQHSKTDSPIKTNSTFANNEDEDEGGKKGGGASMHTSANEDHGAFAVKGAASPHAKKGQNSRLTSDESVDSAFTQRLREKADEGAAGRTPGAFADRKPPSTGKDVRGGAPTSEYSSEADSAFNQRLRNKVNEGVAGRKPGAVADRKPPSAGKGIRGGVPTSEYSPDADSAFNQRLRNKVNEGVAKKPGAVADRKPPSIQKGIRGGVPTSEYSAEAESSFNQRLRDKVNEGVAGRKPGVVADRKPPSTGKDVRGSAPTSEYLADADSAFNQRLRDKVNANEAAAKKPGVVANAEPQTNRKISDKHQRLPSSEAADKEFNDRLRDKALCHPSNEEEKVELHEQVGECVSPMSTTLPPTVVSDNNDIDGGSCQSKSCTKVMEASSLSPPSPPAVDVTDAISGGDSYVSHIADKLGDGSPSTQDKTSVAVKERGKAITVAGEGSKDGLELQDEELGIASRNDLGDGSDHVKATFSHPAEEILTAPVVRDKDKPERMSVFKEGSTPMLEATLVEEEPDMPVYEAECVKPVPWYKKKRTLGMVSVTVIVALVATLGAVLGSRKDDDDSKQTSFTEPMCSELTNTSFRVRLHGVDDAAHNSSAPTGVEVYLGVNYGSADKISYQSKMSHEEVLFSGTTDNWTSPGYFTCNFPNSEDSSKISILVCRDGNGSNDTLKMNMIETLVWNSSIWEHLWWRKAKSNRFWGIPSLMTPKRDCVQFYPNGIHGENIEVLWSRADKPTSSAIEPICSFSPDSCLSEGQRLTGTLMRENVTIATANNTAMTFSVRLYPYRDANKDSTQTGVDIYLIDNEKFQSNGEYEARMISDSVIYPNLDSHWQSPGNITCDVPENELSSKLSIIICSFGIDRLNVKKIDVQVWNTVRMDWEGYWSLMREGTFWGFPSTFNYLSECVRYDPDGSDQRVERPKRQSDSSYCIGGDEHVEDELPDVSDTEQGFRVKLAITAGTRSGVEVYLVNNVEFDDRDEYEARMVYDDVVFNETTEEWTSPDSFLCNFNDDDLDLSIVICPLGVDPFDITEAELLKLNEEEWTSMISWRPISFVDGLPPRLPSRDPDESDCIRFDDNGKFSRPLVRPKRRSSPPSCRVIVEN